MQVRRDFSEYRPWSGAVDTMDKIETAGKLEELESYLASMFIDDIPTEGEINDILWFDGETVLADLGIVDEDEDDEDYEDDEEDED